MQNKQQQRQYVMTVGNIEKSVATLVDLDYNAIELPRYLLPQNTQPGHVIRVTLTHDHKEEEKRRQTLQKVENSAYQKQFLKNEIPLVNNFELLKDHEPISLIWISSAIELTAKKSSYGVDGTGRDSYIKFNNGGNFRGHVQEGRGKFECGVFPTTGRGRVNSDYSRIEGRPLHYIGDGTGRDVYVISNQGGIATGYSGRPNFLATLRHPIPRTEFKPSDIYSRTQVQWRGRMPSHVGNEQRRLDRRLSQHRRHQDPYTQMRTTFRDSMRKGL